MHVLIATPHEHTESLTWSDFLSPLSARNEEEATKKLN
jgi:hypothetical protein